MKRVVCSCRTIPASERPGLDGGYTRSRVSVARPSSGTRVSGARRGPRQRQVRHEIEILRVILSSLRSKRGPLAVPKTGPRMG